MIFWIIFLFTLEYGHCCLNQLNPNFRRNLKFPANKYKAIPGCGNDTEATFCTDYDEKEKNFNPNIMTSPLQINNGAAYESDTINDVGRWWLYINGNYYNHHYFVSDNHSFIHSFNHTDKGMIQTCQTQRMIVTPVKALSITANKWKYIAHYYWLLSNYPAEYFSRDHMVRVIQKMVVNKCKNAGKPCNGCDGKSICKQMYGTKMLIALDDDGNSRLDEFRIPQGCSCFRKK